MKPKIKKEEMETIINIEYPEGVASVYSSYPAERRRLAKMAKEHPGHVNVTLDDGIGIRVEVPIKWVVVRPPRKGRTLTEEQRKALIANFAGKKEDDSVA